MTTIVHIKLLILLATMHKMYRLFFNKNHKGLTLHYPRGLIIEDPAALKMMSRSDFLVQGTECLQQNVSLEQYRVRNQGITGQSNWFGGCTGSSPLWMKPKPLPMAVVLKRSTS
jgi:hypothetical protein